MDVVGVDSCAHYLQWLWIDLAPLEVFQNTYRLILRSPTCLVDDILDPRRHSSTIQHDDQPPLAIINRVGLLWITLPTVLSFPHFHTF